jgi:small subunit ribosomal protein S23
VVQRQLYLMEVKEMSKAQAYDVARKEFYALRQREEIERRIAIEEARMSGAYFGKNNTQVSQVLEDAMYEKWKKWAIAETARMEAERASAYTNVVDLGEGEGAEESPDDEED